MSGICQRLFAFAFACIGWALAESVCVDYNRPPYNSSSTSVCPACVSDPCGTCTFCTEGRISVSAYCTSDLSQCPTDNQKRRQIDCPQQETTQSSSVRPQFSKRQKNELSSSDTAHFDCSRDRVVLGNEAAIDLGISKQILLSNKVQGENFLLYEMFADLCGSVKNLTCPLSNSPILAVNKDLDDCIEIGERLSDEVYPYLSNPMQGLSGGFQFSLGQIRCCSNSTTRKINVTLQILCNSNSPGLELVETDVLSKLGNCNGLNNLTVTLQTSQLCSENIQPLNSLPGWAKVVYIVFGVNVAMGPLLFTVLGCKYKRRSTGESKKDRLRSTKTTSGASGRTDNPLSTETTYGASGRTDSPRSTELTPGKTDSLRSTETTPGKTDSLRSTEMTPGKTDSLRSTEMTPGKTDSLLSKETTSGNLKQRFLYSADPESQGDRASKESADGSSDTAGDHRQNFQDKGHYHPDSKYFPKHDELP